MKEFALTIQYGDGHQIGEVNEVSYEPLGNLNKSEKDTTVTLSENDDGEAGVTEKGLLDDISKLISKATGYINEMKTILDSTASIWQGETADIVKTKFAASQEIVLSSINNMYTTLNNQINDAITEIKASNIASSESAKSL